MFLSIVFISIIIGILFLVVLISLGFFIYSTISKRTDLHKKSLRFLLSAAFAWILLIGVNTFLIIKFVYNNGEKIIDTALETTDRLVSNGYSLPIQFLEKKWEKNRLAKLENLTIFLDSIKYETRGDLRKYTIGLIFNNNSPTDVKLYFSDLLENNYIVACDKDDFVYPMQLRDKQGDLILFGKSRHYFLVDVPRGVEIDHIRYVYKNITLDD
ncbi:MAG: hypothetical protein LBB72_03545 [Spirochaetaceae bacterium]|jgi:hypothetical protein|nr:hypothetical protein [Spirochaetaceae bacterium]